MWWAAVTPMLLMLGAVGLEWLEAALLDVAQHDPTAPAASDHRVGAAAAGSATRGSALSIGR